MIDTVLIESNASSLTPLVNKITKCCPCLSVTAVVPSAAEAILQLQENQCDLLVADLEILTLQNLKECMNRFDTELIFTASTKNHALEVLQSRAAEYIIKPILDQSLINAVERVRRRLAIREENNKNKVLLKNLLLGKKNNQTIGIPTMEGFVFFSTSEIIRCEGLQKCTRIITTTKTDIISSYNIGEFRKLLEPYGFFTTHKSHLINLAFVKHYRREGTIILKDNSSVPVAKRRKSPFVKQVIHPQHSR